MPQNARMMYKTMLIGMDEGCGKVPVILFWYMPRII